MTTDMSPEQPTSQAQSAVTDEQARESGMIEELGTEQCWQYLRDNELGRLAIAAAGEVDIFPLNYAVGGESIVFRTTPGTKLVEVVISGKAAFEIDGYDPEHGQAWSVVAKGRAELIENWDEIYEAQDLPLFPWNHAPKERYIRFTPDVITGRQFTVYATRQQATDS